MNQSTHSNPLPNNWVDHYVEPHHNQIYGKDKRGNWFDKEGRKLEAPVFLQNDVLVSLPGKKSKQSLSFRGQALSMSPHCTLIQIGKVVYDVHLEMVSYYGQKITGLGPNNITLAKSSFIQEVYLGLDQKAYLTENDLQPFLILGELVIQHLHTVKKGKNQYEVFKTKQNTYVLNAISSEVLCCD
ncbi:MAG: hypothetical protein ACI9VN_003503, partial [Patescibacteria group bacterium]